MTTIDSIQAFRAGFLDAEDLRSRLKEATFWCEAPDTPGFIGRGPEPTVSIHTSERSLLEASGVVAWFSTTGEDLGGLAPPGMRFVVDPGQRHAIVVKREALR